MPYYIMPVHSRKFKHAGNSFSRKSVHENDNAGEVIAAGGMGACLGHP